MSKSRVKVFVRFRPTANFAYDSIEILDDQQVTSCTLDIMIFLLKILSLKL